MIINRQKYLDELISLRHDGMIKIVTGIRRCGKSFLLSTIFGGWLRDQGIDEAHIININLEDRRNMAMRDPDNLLAYIDSRLKDDNMHYIMIDEIQLVTDFEDVLNSYLNMPNADVYVTGSNARFLSSSIRTEFAGRGEEVRLYPLSFKEFSSIKGPDYILNLREYMIYGGMPQVVLQDTEYKKTSTLKALFQRTYIRDIVERYKIRNVDVMDDLLNFLASSIGGLTNPTKLCNTFDSVKHIKVNRGTLTSYLEYLKESYLTEQSMQYDIKGKRYIDSPFKVYFTDCGLRNARLNFRQIEFTHLLENVIFNELLIRGYNVDVGVVEKRIEENGHRTRRTYEVDFVCNQGSKRYYLQSAYKMVDEAKIVQEETSLRNIDDSFKKIIVIGESTPVIRNDAGITIMSVYDFLLNENSLDM